MAQPLRGLAPSRHNRFAGLRRDIVAFMRLQDNRPAFPTGSSEGCRERGRALLVFFLSTFFCQQKKMDFSRQQLQQSQQANRAENKQGLLHCIFAADPISLFWDEGERYAILLEKEIFINS